MSHSRRASSKIQVVDPTRGAPTVDEVNELAGDPAVLEARSAEQVKQPSGFTKGDGVVGTTEGGPALTARDIVAQRAERATNAPQLQALNKSVAGGTLSRVDIERELAVLSSDGFSQAAQQVFIRQVKDLARLNPLERLSAKQKKAELNDGQKAELAWLAETIRKTTTSDDDVGTLSGFFDDYGIRLQLGAEYDQDKHFSSLDRAAFRRHLDAIRDNGGTLTYEALSHILGMLGDVTDVRDMKWARGQLVRRVTLGLMHIPDVVEVESKTGGPPRQVKLRKMFDDFTWKELKNEVDAIQIRAEASALRKALSAFASPQSGTGVNQDALTAAIAAARKRFEASIHRAAELDDPDALHDVRRAIKNGFGSTCGCNEGRLLRDELLDLIDSRKGDKLDRFARRRQIAEMLARGELTPAQAHVARAAVALSKTNDEYSATLPRLNQYLRVPISAALLAAMTTDEAIREDMARAAREAEHIRIEEQQLRLTEERLAQDRQFVARVTEEGQLLRQRTAQVADSDSRLRQAQSSRVTSQVVTSQVVTKQVVHKHETVRVATAHVDLTRATFKRATTQIAAVWSAKVRHAVLRFAAQSGFSHALAKLTTASSREQVSRALGEMGVFAPLIAKHSGAMT